MFSLNENPFGMILIILPLITFISSMVLQILTNKRLIILSTVFFGYLVATFSLFNSTFLIWCFVYTGIAVIGTLIGTLIRKVFTLKKE